MKKLFFAFILLGALVFAGCIGQTQSEPQANAPGASSVAPAPDGAGKKTVDSNQILAIPSELLIQPDLSVRWQEKDVAGNFKSPLNAVFGGAQLKPGGFECRVCSNVQSGPDGEPLPVCDYPDGFQLSFAECTAQNSTFEYSYGVYAYQAVKSASDSTSGDAALLDIEITSFSSISRAEAGFKQDAGKAKGISTVFSAGSEGLRVKSSEASTDRIEFRRNNVLVNMLLVSSASDGPDELADYAKIIDERLVNEG